MAAAGARFPAAGVLLLLATISVAASGVSTAAASELSGAKRELLQTYPQCEFSGVYLPNDNNNAADASGPVDTCSDQARCLDVIVDGRNCTRNTVNGVAYDYCAVCIYWCEVAGAYLQNQFNSAADASGPVDTCSDQARCLDVILDGRNCTRNLVNNVWYEYCAVCIYWVSGEQSVEREVLLHAVT
ncbi:hypothetical protein HYH03_012486 [Edaphochlamys debaryana]|uniref:Uncharacterized protein n=1 Tax=Edaphochlamys debaryana TaxID=47281 RepID=A0A835XY71_9CHLO|nr:hypothetical protein HYH03_012486 [Edaphochlamys debaryana]|eukprot:KAG2489050.1 hypothetical protein HYH03_012486 [Edaphochlamys debaryana]